MSYEVNTVNPELTEEEKKKKESEGLVVQAPNAPMTSGGTQEVQKEAPATPGAGVTDINKYLDANRAKVQQLAGNVANVVKGDITGARTSLESAKDKFTQDVGAGTVAYDQGLAERAKSLVDQSQYKQGQAESFLGNQADVERFQKLYGGQYGGPQDIYSQQYYQDAATQAKKAQRSSGLVDTDIGRQELITRAMPSETGRYSKGALTLDQALLAGDQQAMAQLRAAQAENDIQSKLDALKAASLSSVEAAKQTSADTAKQMREQFNLGNEESELAKYADTITAQAKEAYLKKQKELEALGIKEGVSALDPNYFSLDPVSNINKYNVASKADYERLKALEKLTGQTSTFTPYESKAGMYTEFVNPDKTFNKTKYEAAIKANMDYRLAQEKAAADFKAAQEKAAAEAAARQKELEKQNTGTMIGVGVGAAAGGAIGGPVGAVVGGAIGGAIGGAFCFDPDTEFEMADGSYKKLSDMKVGEILNEGGKILTISDHLFQGYMYGYPTTKGEIFVTGSHAVKENGKWTRVMYSKLSNSNPEHYCEFVRTLSCENHIMLTGGVVFADYQEIDNDFGLTDEQCLEILNKDA